MAAKPQQRVINLGDMDLQQLLQIRMQLDQEIEFLVNSLQQLQGLKRKFQESSDCIKRQSTVDEESEIMVPLTGSMYVKGNVMNRNKFLVDIGTGYYVEKDLDGATDFFQRKINFLSGQIDKLHKVVQEKSNIRANIEAVGNAKRAAMSVSPATASTSSQ